MTKNRRTRRGLTALAALAGLLAVANPLSALARDETYTIGDGDTLSEIAASYGTTIDDLAALNGISDPDLIVSGEVLVLPDAWDAGDGGWSETADTADEQAADIPAEAGRSGDSWSYGDESAWVDPPYVDQETIVALLTQAAEMYGWDPSLILAQAWQESRWRQDGVSEAGAIGVMQVLPDTAAGIGDWYLGREVDPWNSVWDNIESGVAYLTVLYEETGSVGLALAAYYQGLGSLQREGWYPDTMEYVNLIFYWQERIQAGDL